MTCLRNQSQKKALPHHQSKAWLIKNWAFHCTWKEWAQTQAWVDHRPPHPIHLGEQCLESPSHWTTVVVDLEISGSEECHHKCVIFEDLKITIQNTRLQDSRRVLPGSTQNNYILEELWHMLYLHWSRPCRIPRPDYHWDLKCWTRHHSTVEVPYLVHIVNLLHHYKLSNRCEEPCHVAIVARRCQCLLLQPVAKQQMSITRSSDHMEGPFNIGDNVPNYPTRNRHVSKITYRDHYTIKSMSLLCTFRWNIAAQSEQGTSL